MATRVPPTASKKQRLLAEIPQDLDVLVRFESLDSHLTSDEIKIPASCTIEQLDRIVKSIVEKDESVATKFSFNVEINGQESIPIVHSLYKDVLQSNKKRPEELIKIQYSPQALFRVNAAGRCSSEIKGHDANIIAVQFAPFGCSRLLTGSGDFTARIWDTDTETPLCKLSGHDNWVNCVAWNPDGKIVATGSMDCSIRCWDPVKKTLIGSPLKKHSQAIMSIAWEPFHSAQKNKGIYRLVSGSKDATLRIWNTSNSTQIAILSGHTGPVTCVRWGGRDWIYSCSYDRTVKIWSAETKCMIYDLKKHSARVNHLALSSDYILRMGPWDHNGNFEADSAQKRFDELYDYQKWEKLVSTSDDLQTFLWNPEKSLNPIAKMHGHQKVVNHAAFSPDGRFIATASFDGSVRLWSAVDGKYLTTLRGHVANVYQCSWSADSRLLATASKDTTLKVWDIGSRKLLNDLPGHKDQVFAVDWSPDGQKIASGGADKMVRIWRH